MYEELIKKMHATITTTWKIFHKHLKANSPDWDALVDELSELNGIYKDDKIARMISEGLAGGLYAAISTYQKEQGIED